LEWIAVVAKLVIGRAFVRPEAHPAAIFLNLVAFMVALAVIVGWQP
jgi:hypothetical protein